MQKVSSSEAAAACRDALGNARRLLIIGGYGCGNLGDEAILSVLADEWRADRDLRVVSADPESTRTLHGIQAIGTNPRGIASSLRSMDALVVGGGGIFSGYMGKRSMALPLMALAAQALGKAVIVRALGAYGSTPRAVALPLSRMIDRAAFASVRDEASATALVRFGSRREMLVEPDPALRLARTGYPGALPQEFVAFALRRVRSRSIQAVLEAEHLAAIDEVTSNGAHAVLLPFCLHPSARIEDDLDFARELRSQCALPSSVTALEDVKTPGEMLDIVSRARRLVAMRFHAIVFGTMARVPMDIIAYDDKCASFARERGLAYRWAGDLATEGVQAYAA